jgi:signal transduction histidine kinase
VPAWPKADAPKADALARSERRFRLAVQASGSLAYEWHIGRGTVEWFGDVDGALGLPQGALPRTLVGWEQMLHPDDRGWVTTTLAAACEARGPFSVSYRVIRADGSVRWWREHGLYMAGDSLEDGVFVGACTDFTSQRAGEEQLRHAQQLEAIATLAGGMAHDVNNLLSVVTGYGELLRDQLQGRDTGLELLDEVMQAVQRTGTLTRHLLAFSRRQVLHPRVVPIGPLVDGLAEVLRAVAGPDVRVHVRVAADAPAVRIDPAQLEQVLVHLATNAREAMRDGGDLHVAVGRDARGDARIEVRDTGRGMSAELQSRMFEPFFTTKPGGRGTGLGLSAAYGIVQQHGGTITVTSALGSGTTFHIALPATSAPTEPVSPAVEVSPPPATTGERVLVVEDDAVFGLLMRRLLVSLGYEVTLAGSVQEAMQHLATAPTPVDVVITDVIMPGGSGLELAGQLALSHPGVPVLFMSGYTAEQLERTGRGVRSSLALLEKPFTQEQLGRAVRNALAARLSGS